MNDPHLRAVPNPPQNGNETRDLIKTVAITSAVSSLVGVFAVAGGQAIYDLLRTAIRGKKNDTNNTNPGPTPNFYPNPNAPPVTPPRYDDEIPEALRMEPRLRGTSSRRRKDDDLRRALRDFEQRQNQRFADLEQRIENHYHDEDDLEEDDD